ncbi:hypothetical protein L228DRAFT_269614 [Xylona heveae TC161]|uniref:Uncharacterized protein n=1 Tax=Xylona heveae (strain CBS 132557 / TC161) TaxID=1328760 RepID=A0A165FPC7_XYLHT|nr:hypothetical protein L228DRAFT_269614 [Xylona heveae TC161]KZF21223.1 hypothetical protein L228DRAFT_269614 [Xylona heveae TC161]
MSGKTVKDVKAYVDEIVDEFRTGAQCMESNRRGHDWPEAKIQEAVDLYESLLYGQSSVRSEFENHFHRFGKPFQAGNESTLASLQATLVDLQAMTNSLLRGWVRDALSLDFTTLYDTANVIRSDTLMALGQLCRHLRESLSTSDEPPSLSSTRSSFESFQTAMPPAHEARIANGLSLPANLSTRRLSIRQSPTRIVSLSSHHSREQLFPKDSAITVDSKFCLPDVAIDTSDLTTLTTLFQKEEAEKPARLNTLNRGMSRGIGSIRSQRRVSSDRGSDKESVMNKVLSVVGFGSGTNSSSASHSTSNSNSRRNSAGKPHHNNDSMSPVTLDSPASTTSVPRTTYSIFPANMSSHAPEVVNPDMLPLRIPPTWPSPSNNYSGFCKGAWKLREGLKGAMRLRERPIGMYATSYYWRCDKCVFEGIVHGPDKRHAAFDERVRTAHGIQYRWVFLAKCHVYKGQYTPDQSDSLGCIFCCAEGLRTPAYGNVESLLFHISQKHRNAGDVLGRELLSRIKCIVGRVALPKEDFEINILPAQEIAELEADN